MIELAIGDMGAVIADMKLHTGESVNEGVWKAYDSRIWDGNKPVMSYEFDRDSDAFWVDQITKRGQLSFDTKDELIKWVKKNPKEWEWSNEPIKENLITEKQLKGLEGIPNNTTLEKITKDQKLNIIKGSGNIISFVVPSGVSRNFWQVIGSGKIKKNSTGEYYLEGRGPMKASPTYKTLDDLIKGVDWKSMEQTRRFNESINEGKSDKFKLGTPARFKENGKEYSGEVTMNPSNQRLNIGGQWRMVGKGTVKGISLYSGNSFVVPDNWNDVKKFNESVNEASNRYDNDSKKAKFIRKKGNIITFKKPFGPTSDSHKQIISYGVDKRRGKVNNGSIKIIGRAYDTPWFASEKDLYDAIDWDWMENAHLGESVNERKEFPSKEKLVAYMVKGGHNKDSAKRVVDANYEYVKKHYQGWGLPKISDVLWTVESVNEIKKPKPRTNRWLELKNDETKPNEKLAMGLKELKYKLKEIESFIGWYNKISKMNELSSDSYWKRTNNHIYKIKERLINIARTIQELEQ
jgi:hypothetical protein